MMPYRMAEGNVSIEADCSRFGESEPWFLRFFDIFWAAHHIYEYSLGLKFINNTNQLALHPLFRSASATVHYGMSALRISIHNQLRNATAARISDSTVEK